MKQCVKRYNVFFPLWMLWLFPALWCVILPANFIFDSLVLIAAKAGLHIADKKQTYKKAIVRVWLFGILMARNLGPARLHAWLAPVQRKKLSLILAFATAPYLFLLPTTLLYKV